MVLVDFYQFYILFRVMIIVCLLLLSYVLIILCLFCAVSVIGHSTVDAAH